VGARRAAHPRLCHTAPKLPKARGNRNHSGCGIASGSEGARNRCNTARSSGLRGRPAPSTGTLRQQGRGVLRAVAPTISSRGKVGTLSNQPNFFALQLSRVEVVKPDGCCFGNGFDGDSFPSCHNSAGYSVVGMVGMPERLQPPRRVPATQRGGGLSVQVRPRMGLA
jgi:hypothetical protein